MQRSTKDNKISKALSEFFYVLLSFYFLFLVTKKAKYVVEGTDKTKDSLWVLKNNDTKILSLITHRALGMVVKRRGSGRGGRPRAVRRARPAIRALRGVTGKALILFTYILGICERSKTK